MEIRVVSDDSELSKLCAEILEEIVHDQSWSLSLTSVEGLSSPADVYVWDFQPSAALPPLPLGCTSSNLVVLAQRRDLAALKKALGFEANVALRPVTRGTLSALLHFAVSSRTHDALRGDRELIFQSLLETNLKLQEYDQHRTNFLTRIVHDFRAPLTALDGYCGLLLGGPLGPLNENQTEVIRRMQLSAKRLSRMASAMLQLSVDRRVKRRPDLRRGDFRNTLEQVLHEIHPIAAEKGLTIASELIPSAEALYFDPSQIDQVLVNLLDNACRFTPRGGTIKICAYPFFWDRRSRDAPVAEDRGTESTTETNSYRVDVRDSGPVLPKEHLESIFEEYTSYAGGQDRSGGGLGLAICRMIVSEHDGKVWAENTPTGPMFSFVIPLRRFGSTRAHPSALSA